MSEAFQGRASLFLPSGTVVQDPSDVDQYISSLKKPFQNCCHHRRIAVGMFTLELPYALKEDVYTAGILLAQTITFDVWQM